MVIKYKKIFNLPSILFSKLPTDTQQLVRNILYRSYFLVCKPIKGDRKKFLFVLAHQRSGSTLLVHLLNTSSEILGYGETHISYKSKIDLDTLVGKISWETGKGKIVERYIMDKMVCNNSILDKKILHHQDLYLVFIVREPKESIQSILKSGFYPSWNEQDAMSYYLERLAELEEYAKTINNKERSLFLTHTQLIGQTQLVFKAIQQFLSLRYTLSENYEIITTTSKRFIGDVSSNMKTGRIVRKEKELEFNISPDVIEECLRGFHRCCNTLSQYCTVIDTTELSLLSAKELDCK